MDVKPDANKKGEDDKDDNDNATLTEIQRKKKNE